VLAYAHAYQQTSIAWHIDAETGYADDALPFPSLLTDAQRDNLREGVSVWREERERLLAK